MDVYLKIGVEHGRVFAERKGHNAVATVEQRRFAVCKLPSPRLWGKGSCINSQKRPHHASEEDKTRH